MKKINKIRSWERDQIAIMLASGTSFRLIASGVKEDQIQLINFEKAKNINLIN